MKTLTLLLTVAFVLAACQPTTPLMVAKKCKTSQVITINTNRDTVQARPDNRCAQPGETFFINIVPKNKNKDTVMIIAKGINPDGGGPMNWITRTNTNNGDKIEITVPEKSYFDDLCDLSKDDCEFDYAIFVNGKRPVDPRVTVRE
ncbi:MAG: hypothetical protein HKP32_12990 [Woeseia sp.]|nr:hypothetical protein [Woeseia sp.]